MPTTTIPEPVFAQRVAVPAALQGGVIICLDPGIDSAAWATLVADLSTVAHATGLAHFVARSVVVAPYCHPSPAQPNHQHHLLNACNRTRAVLHTWPQFILAVIPDNMTSHIVKHFGHIEHAITTQCVHGRIILDGVGSRRTQLDDALARLNVKLGGAHAMPMDLPLPLFHTLVVGGALQLVPGTGGLTVHCVLVACMDHSRHRWYSATAVQLHEVYTILNIGTMLGTILDLVREPVARILYIRNSLPPYRLAKTAAYERQAIRDAVFHRNTTVPPPVTVVVPWGPDCEATCPDEFDTFDTASFSYAVPICEFGRGWNTSALRAFVLSLAYDFAYRNTPLAFPAPLSYAMAASNFGHVHYPAAGVNSNQTKALSDYLPLSSHIAQTPYWL